MPQNQQNMSSFIKKGEELFLPNTSVDNVIFGYESNRLKVLLVQITDTQWMLPGGYVFKHESLHEAAKRILEERISLREVYLKQFHAFGSPERSFPNEIKSIFEKLCIPLEQNPWIGERFITIAYYALVDIQKANPQPNQFAKACDWYPIDKLPDLLLDHGDIIAFARKSFLKDLEEATVAPHLLPDRFTMPELHGLYETVLQKHLDRSRFQKNMLATGKFARQGKKTGVAHKSPYYYRIKHETI
jgi:ADP-ribose pyrophosphatase YjhB (NUDIX family)